MLTQNTSLEGQDVEKIIESAHSRNAPLYNAAAQVWNHAFYWASMRPGGGGAAHGTVAALIEEAFGSESAFNEQFTSLAGALFGSGWLWLVLDQDRLRIVATSNADNPTSQGFAPLLTLDLWEHSYYLDYEHRRLDYVAAFLSHLVDWNSVNRRLQTAMARRSADRVGQQAVGASSARR
jgi:Fe-Mn family superoxide dismutase